jgi:3-hydroxyanthranilate 3,4-dioxygenase
MEPCRVVSLDGIVGAGEQLSVLWQEEESLAFVANGRAYRSEFHVNPSHETMLQLRGEMRLHYLTPDGQEHVRVLRAGDYVYCPPGLPHSPRFPPGAFALVTERRRRPGEIDRFLWFCERCRAQVHEVALEVRDYAANPVSAAYREYYGAAAHRTCRACGHVNPAPADRSFEEANPTPRPAADPAR